MTVRMTGITGLLDTDALVTATMLPYKTKVNTQKQSVQILQWQQEQYKSIIKSSKTFYNKYLTSTGSSSLIKPSVYNTTKFTSSNKDAVTAKATNGASISNYSVSVKTLATASSATLEDKDNSIVAGNKITITSNGVPKEFTLEGNSKNEIANNLTEQLKNENINVTAKYSDFAANGKGGLIIQNEQSGSEELTIKITSAYSSNSENSVSATTTGKFTINVGKDNLKDGNKIIINDKEYTLSGSNEEEIVKNLDSELSADNIEINAVYNSETGKMSLVSQESGEDNQFIASLKIDTTTTSLKGDIDGKYSTEINISDITNKRIIINGKNIEIDTDFDGNIDIKSFNDALKSNKIGITAEILDGKLKITSESTGKSGKFATQIPAYSNINEDTSNSLTTNKVGTFLEAEITNGDNTYTIDLGKEIRNNGIILDNVEFTFNEVTVKKDADGSVIEGSDTPIKIIGQKDVTELKDKIVSFINDYNSLLESINTKLYETRNKSYTPLTDEQKKEMSDDEIKKWEDKAQTGLLRKDSDLEQYANKMKEVMSTFLKDSTGSGIDLESVGIKPVADYTDKNGMFTIDEDKLSKALEENFDGVKDLFISNISSNDTKSMGIIGKLESAINNNAVSLSGNLVKKAGSDTGVSTLTNEISKQLTEKQKLIKEMEAALTERENILYKKYASLESTLSSLQSQQSSLTQYFSSDS